MIAIAAMTAIAGMTAIAMTIAIAARRPRIADGERGTVMGFYEELARHYDEVFPASPAELGFVGGLIAGRRRLLDIGCGTGNKTEILARNVGETVAFDLDAGMIARAKASHAAANVEYRTLDMLRLREAFPPESFDSAVCLGNTLAHLSADGVHAFLGELAAVMSPGGVFVVQLVNYDRILEQGIDALPRIETDGATFVRRYRWRDGEMHFVTTLEAKETGERFDNDIVLNPIRRDELAAALAAASFGGVRWFGSYAGDEYRADNSFHLIAVGALSTRSGACPR